MDSFAHTITPGEKWRPRAAPNMDQIQTKKEYCFRTGRRELLNLNIGR